jgi:hypothetical protein
MNETRTARLAGRRGLRRLLCITANGKVASRVMRDRQPVVTQLWQRLILYA